MFYKTMTENQKGARNWDLFVFFFSLCTITHGVTAVYPSRAFDAGAVLAALQEEKWVLNMVEQ